MKPMRCLMLLLMLLGPLWSGEVEALVRQLGAESASSRVEAQQALAAAAREKPRHMLIRLAEAYADTQDLEVQARLEVLLSDLAREWMFYHPPGFLGVNFRMIYAEDGNKTVEILQLISGGAAEQAGLRSNDRLLEIDGRKIADMQDQEEFADAISRFRPKERVLFVVQRREEQFAITIPLGMRDAEFIDMGSSSREEEQKIRDWLDGLRPEPRSNPREPIGHFRVGP